MHSLTGNIITFMTNEEIIQGLQFTIDMFLFDPFTGESLTEPRNDDDKITIDACREAIIALKAEPCEDAVSREAVLDAIDKWVKDKSTYIALAINEGMSLLERIKALPPVTPKPKTGYWIDDCPMMTDEGLVRVIRCSCCNEQRKDYYGVSKNYCPKCGTKMEGENE